VVAGGLGAGNAKSYSVTGDAVNSATPTIGRGNWRGAGWPDELGHRRYVEHRNRKRGLRRSGVSASQERVLLRQGIRVIREHVRKKHVTRCTIGTTLLRSRTEANVDYSFSLRKDFLAATFL
jgi:hypothetical protein